MVSGCFFFFKQKTAYEMRISDWSSDVCSSDLLIDCHICRRDVGVRRSTRVPASWWCRVRAAESRPKRMQWGSKYYRDAASQCCVAQRCACDDDAVDRAGVSACAFEIGRDTSELQSIMRISYAVFFLTKK